MMVTRTVAIRFSLDVLIAVGWAASLAALGDIDARPEIVVALGVTFLAGLLSGRFRILALAIGGLLVAGLIASGGASCDPSTCEDDISPAWEWILFIVFVTIPAVVMALGVTVRRAWARHRAREEPSVVQ